MPLSDKLRVMHTVCRLGQPLAVIDNLPGEGAEFTPIQLRQLASVLIQAASDCEAALDTSRRWMKTRREYTLGAETAVSVLSAEQFGANSLKRAHGMAFRAVQATSAEVIERLRYLVSDALQAGDGPDEFRARLHQTLAAISAPAEPAMKRG